MSWNRVQKVSWLGGMLVLSDAPPHLGRRRFHYPFFRQALKNMEEHSFRFVDSNDNFPILAGWGLIFQLELDWRTGWQ